MLPRRGGQCNAFPERSGLVLLVTSNFSVVALRAQSPPTKLYLTIIEGNGAINNLRLRANREPIVQVTDQNHRPVAGGRCLLSSQDGGGWCLQRRQSPQGNDKCQGARQSNRVPAKCHPGILRNSRDRVSAGTRRFGGDRPDKRAGRHRCGGFFWRRSGGRVRHVGYRRGECGHR